MRIALVPEHANPLATVGSVDAGGQNVHVAALAGGLAQRGHEVTVYSRRDSTSAPDRVRTAEGFDGAHVPAGPPSDVPKDELLPHLPAFAAHLRRRWERAVALVHAHFWMSGVASVEAAAGLDVPVLQTFHALGTVKRRQGPRDTNPGSRVGIERQRLLVIGRLVERKGVGNVIEALAELPDVELVVGGGPAADLLDTDPQARQLSPGPPASSALTRP